MGGLFNEESRFMNLLGRVTDLVILNLCFIVSCLPVVTAGAGLTALYAVNLKMVRNEEAYIFKSFWRAFKENFKQSTICWLIFLAAGGIFIADYRLAGVLPEQYAGIFRVVLTVLLFIYLFMMCYVFPYMARFEDKLGTCLKNAFLIGASNIGYTILMVVIAAACAVITFYSLNLMLTLALVWFFAGFALLSFINSCFLRKVFSKYERI